MENDNKLYGFSANEVKLAILGWVRPWKWWRDRFETCTSFYFEKFVLQISVILLLLWVTIIAMNLSKLLLVNYAWPDGTYNKVSENINFYSLTLSVMAVVLDLLRAKAE